MEILSIKRSLFSPQISVMYPKVFDDKQLLTFLKPELILIKYRYQKRNFAYLVNSSEGNDLLYNFSRPIEILIKAKGRQIKKIHQVLQLLELLEINPISIPIKYWIFIGIYTLKKSILEETIIKSLIEFAPEINVIQRYQIFLKNKEIKK